MGDPSVRVGLGGIRAVLLDAVGTLIEADPPVAEVYAEVAWRQGLMLDPAGIKTRFHTALQADGEGGAEPRLATDEPTERRRWQQIVATVLGDLPDPERAFLELWEHFASPGSWRCYADVAPALEALQSVNIPVRIASNFDSRLRGVVAGLPELAGLRTSLVISSEVGYRKPHAAFFSAACADLGLPPEEVLSVGDDWVNDVEGARRAGLPALWINRFAKPEPLTGVPSAPDLAAAVGLLLAGRGEAGARGRPI